MKIQIFEIPLSGGDAVQEMNHFLSSHRIVTNNHYLAARGGGVQVLVFVIEYQETNTPRQERTQVRVDVRDELPAHLVGEYDRLRELREEIAKREDVKLFKIFSNRQLAEMLLRQVTDEAGLLSIPGISDAKVQKYGKEFLEQLHQILANSKDGPSGVEAGVESMEKDGTAENEASGNPF